MEKILESEPEPQPNTPTLEPEPGLESATPAVAPNDADELREQVKRQAKQIERLKRRIVSRQSSTVTAIPSVTVITEQPTERKETFRRFNSALRPWRKRNA